jgi:hypothetical protein
MANIKISQLPSLSQLANTTQFPVANANVTYNITASNMQAYMATYPGGTFTGANVTVTNTLRGATLSVTGTALAPTPPSNSSNLQIATTAFVTNAIATTVPSGVIVMWSGSVASVPGGWFLCNGFNNTPDLRNRFIVGAGNTYAVAATGGSANAVVVSHDHTATSTVTDPGHAHIYNTKAGTQPQSGSSTQCWNGDRNATTGVATTGVTVATTVNPTGVSAVNANLPPYYALAYIMKA